MRTEIERRPLVLFAAGLIFGLAAPTHWPVALAALVFVAILSNWAARGVTLGAVLLGLLLTPTPPTILMEREYVDGSATVIGVPKIYPDRQSCTVDVGGRKMVLRLEPNACVSMGDELHVVGIAKPLSEISEPIYRPRGVVARLTPIRWSIVRSAPAPMKLADGLRRGFIGYTARVLPNEAAASIDALSFNADSLLDERTEDALRQTGTIHLVSASGLQVLILSQALLTLLSLSPLPRSAQIALVASLLALYAMATGLHGPIVRATVACALSSAAYLVRREPDMVSALAAAAIGVLLWHPYEVYQPGFQLSFVTVTAFALFLRGGETPWRWIRSSLVASAATAPLVAYHFGYFSVIGLFANAVAAFVVPAIMVLSLAGFALSFLSAALGAGLLMAAAPLVGWMRGSIVWCSNLSFASVALPAFSAYWLMALYGAALLTWRRRVVQA